jgi:hypothetical protein
VWIEKRWSVSICTSRYSGTETAHPHGRHWFDGLQRSAWSIQDDLVNEACLASRNWQLAGQLIGLKRKTLLTLLTPTPKAAKRRLEFFSSSVRLNLAALRNTPQVAT